MAITISTHNGSTVDLPHDRREKWRVDQENKRWNEKHPGEVRIDLNKKHEILIDRGSLRDVYDEIFGDALKEYNNKCIRDGHPNRQIKDYLNYINAHEGTSKKARHPIYEMITSVGSKENPVDEKAAVQILKEHAAGFTKRNPHLIVVCQALHQDENGVPHIHTAYIGVATDQKRGMRVQNSLKGALKQQGIVGDKRTHTAQMIWIKQENKALEEICNAHGYEVVHPQAGTKVEHLSIEEYKASKELETRQEELSKVNNLPLGTTIVKTGRLKQLEDIEKEYLELKPQIDQTIRDKKAMRETLDAYYKAYDKLQTDKTDFEAKVNECANKKVDILKDKALEFIKSIGFIEKFTTWADKAIEVRGIKR